MHQEHHISNFVKFQRNKQKLTQEQLAERAGVGLRFVRELEQGKETLRMDKVNQVLQLFGHALSAKPARVFDPYAILLHYVDKNVHLYMRNKKELVGLLLEPLYEGGEIRAWRFVSANHIPEYRKTGAPVLVQILTHAEIDHIEKG
jgi:y4mF family transcriptional regulator